MQDNLTFGQVLKQWRKSLDLTQEEVAQRAQCAVDSVRKLEADSRYASKEVAQSLAAALELVGRERAEFLRLARQAPADEQPTPREVVVLPTQNKPVPLLATKLYLPRPRMQLVARPRLVARLETGLRGPLTLIAAPAGFGKTTILADWLGRDAATNRQVAWLALDAGDSDPIQFLRYLITAIQTLAPSVGATVLPLLHSAQPPPLEPLLPVLVNDLTHTPEGSILVLDDYHVVDSPAIHQMLAFLLDHLPPQLHVVIASRVDPPLPLPRMRARGQLVELRAADLRFTTEEAAAFLQEVMGVQLSATDVVAIEARTEGWIAGLQLAGLSLQEIPAAQISVFIDSFTGSHRFVVDYLVDEVLANQPAHVQNFLRQTSMLERFCAPLCDAVVGTKHAPSQALLEQLERANLFIVPLDDERRWYRYHHLFAQVLRERLASSATAAEQADLHRRVALWFEEQGIIVEAINHFLAAQEWERTARLIEVHGLLLIVQGHAHAVGSWLKIFPTSMLHAHPYLINLQAIVFFNANDLAAAEKRIQEAEKGLAGNELDERARALLGHITLLRGNIARARGDLARSATLLRQALDDLPTTEMAPRSAATLGMAQIFMVSGDVGLDNQRMVTDAVAAVQRSGNLVTLFNSALTWAEFQRRQGRLRQAAGAYREAAEVASQLFGLQVMPNGASYFFGLGSILLELNDLDAAERLLLQGQEMIQRGRQSHGDFVTLGYVALARLQQSRGNVAAALTTLHDLQSVAEERNFAAHLIARARAAEAQIALQQGESTDALRWTDASVLRLTGELNYLHEQEDLILARIRTAQARRHRNTALGTRALQLLDQMLAHAEAAMRLDSVIQIQVLRALALQVEGEQAAALKILAETLARATPEGYVRVFVDEGIPMAQLITLGLRSAFVTASVRHDAEMLLKVMEGEGILPALAPGPQVASAPSPLADGESLTAREMEVLRLLVTGASNQNIAHQLIVELGTVKRHVSNIMDKLQAQSRLEAVARARALNIV